MIKKGDKILIFLVAIISIISILTTGKSLGKKGEIYALIKVDGKIYKQIEITDPMGPKEIAVRTDFGYNLVEIDSKGARVLEASCRDKLDIKQGTISRPGEILVCLPNRLSVEIIGSSQEQEIDKISGKVSYE